ncbi:MAG: TonB-dependent receptor [Bacteroidetes bacterium]|nr:TonB-dependent receptor [Bacteroidota bacterium]
MRLLQIIIAIFTFSFSASAQTGQVEGKVTDASGIKLTGVSVEVEGVKTVTTNADGNFVLSLPSGKKYSIKLSSVGYQVKQVDDVEVIAGQVSTVNIILERASKTEQAVVVRSSMKKETTAALISYQKNTAVVAQVVSAEAIKRSPDKNTGEVLKRVPGTSIQEGKYLIVRGLADRYNQAMINGVLLSSTEPDRKTFSFDIIPSATIDNIIINKAFIPELPGEWAGGLIQVNTKDVPTKNFLDVQIGTGFNTKTIGNDFYDYKGGKTDFLGYDDGTRGLPAGFPRKSQFNALTAAQKTAYASSFENVWSADKSNSLKLNQSITINGGFNIKLAKKLRLAAILGINYNRSFRNLEYENQINSYQDNVADLSFTYNNNKYSQDILAGAIANFTFQFGNNTKISIKNLLNVNTSDYTTVRTGVEYENAINPSGDGDKIKANELAFKASTFFNTQLSGDHNIKKYDAKLHWFGSFNILDQYIPDQRRLQYIQDVTLEGAPYLAAIRASNASQKSGSRYFGTLSDYIYTVGGDLSKTINVNGQTQTVKGGYFFQVKDRLFNCRPFAIYQPQYERSLLELPADQIFAASNFGNGNDTKLAFNELQGSSYRYLANSILNAAFLQFDNQFAKKFRIVWGLRIEDFDQLIGATKKSDDRFVYNRKRDYLPGVNLTYKINNSTNVRLSGSQTVIRPEFRELSTFQFYDFDLGATVAGNTALERTKVSNFDLRYELYPRAGELFTFGIFYKYFKKPIEVYFNATSGAASSTYNYLNADEANSFGAELEFRKKLDVVSALKNFTVQGNISYIYNRVKGVGAVESRPMQGQSPYLLNASVQYDLQRYGLSTTLLFNQIGRRIAYVGGDDGRQPAIWENPRPVLDLQIAKKVLKSKGEVKLNIADIISKQAIFYNDLNDNKKYDLPDDRFAIKRKYGTNVGISFSYSF